MLPRVGRTGAETVGIDVRTGGTVDERIQRAGGKDIKLIVYRAFLFDLRVILGNRAHIAKTVIAVNGSERAVHVVCTRIGGQEPMRLIFAGGIAGTVHDFTGQNRAVFFRNGGKNVFLGNAFEIKGFGGAGDGVQARLPLFAAEQTECMRMLLGVRIGGSDGDDTGIALCGHGERVAVGGICCCGRADIHAPRSGVSSHHGKGRAGHTADDIAFIGEICIGFHNRIQVDIFVCQSDFGHRSGCAALGRPAEHACGIVVGFGRVGGQDVAVGIIQYLLSRKDIAVRADVVDLVVRHHEKVVQIPGVIGSRIFRCFELEQQNVAAVLVPGKRFVFKRIPRIFLHGFFESIAKACNDLCAVAGHDPCADIRRV